MKFYRWTSGIGMQGVNLQSETDPDDVRTLYIGRNSYNADLFMAQCEIYYAFLREGKTEAPSEAFNTVGSTYIQ